MSSTNSLKIAFLFSSGISIPAGMPCNQNITTRILSGANDRVAKFLERLKFEIDKYYHYKPEPRTNYEDLYYVASQIADSELHEIPNPAVQSLIDKILPDIKQLFISKKNEKRLDLNNLVWETTNYIEDVVCQLLSSNPNSIDYLHFIKEACEYNLMASMNIFTLNHDKILEQFLTKNGIQFTDGFGEPIDNVRRWNPNLFESELYKIRLFKLHGSIDWFRLWPVEGGNWNNEFIGIPINWKFSRQFTKNQPSSILYEKADGRPKILVGTFNKMLNYLTDIFTALFCLFYYHLSNAQRLVICGYGFGDQGINTRIIQWFYSSPDHKITIIHPAPEKLKRAARGAISNKWDEWISQNRLIILPKRIQEITWSDICATV
jgi:hypothetical protein